MSRTQAAPVSHGRRSDATSEKIAPMLALASAELPDDPQNWAFEPKWDGVRALVHWNGSRLRIDSRNQLDITSNYPELHDLADALGRHRLILDGEIVCPDPITGLPDFPRLTRRMHVSSPSDALVRSFPISLMLFDVLQSGRRSTLGLPFSRRREILEELTLIGPCWAVTPSRVGEGKAMLAAATQSRMEGVVAKQLNSVYQPGRRSPAWRKIKVIFGQELVIGGWIPEASGAVDRVGSLLLGYYDCPRRGAKPAFRYAGAVGTGFSDLTHARLVPQLRAVEQAICPFTDALPRKAGVRFTSPKLVAEIQYRRWPAGGSIQQASFKGLRTDKRPEEVVKEVNG